MGLEIYCLGRVGTHTLKSAYVLCDDYSELASKLYLKTEDPTWSDAHSGGRFKNYHRVMKDTRDQYALSQDASALDVIQTRMKERRDRRNEFFHSTSLLDLSVNQTTVAQAFVDLLDYGELLFGTTWQASIENAPRGMRTLEVLARLDLRAVSDPAVPAKVYKVLREQKRNSTKVPAKGAHVAEHPADVHTILSVTWGGEGLYEALRDLLD